ARDSHLPLSNEPCSPRARPTPASTPCTSANSSSTHRISTSPTRWMKPPPSGGP
ncbi:uncharacterized protein METZ01_LOCUS253338, partial [marine metagenome]